MWYPTTSSDELYHYGVLGMRWGIRRYQNYDGTRKAAGKEHEKEKRKGLSDKTKSNLKKAAVAALVIGGVAASAYVISKHPEMLDAVKNGKKVVGQIENKHVSDLMVGDIPKMEETIGKFKKLEPKSIPKSVTDAFGNLSDNPLKKADGIEKNCTNVFLSFAARMKGLDAKPGFQKDSAGNFVENSFENVLKCFNLSEDSTSVNIYTNANRFMGTDNAIKELLRKYPDNGSYGYLDARFSIRGKEFRHAISWMNENGNISFGDGINGLKAKMYFNFIMPSDEVRFFRADNLDMNLDEISKYLQH